MKTNTCWSSQATSQALGRQLLAIKGKFQPNGVSEFPVYPSTIRREHRLPEECYHTHKRTHLSHSLNFGVCTSGGCTGLRQAKISVGRNLTWNEHETEFVGSSLPAFEFKQIQRPACVSPQQAMD